MLNLGVAGILGNVGFGSGNGNLWNNPVYFKTFIGGVSYG